MVGDDSSFRPMPCRSKFTFWATQIIVSHSGCWTHLMCVTMILKTRFSVISELSFGISDTESN